MNLKQDFIDLLGEEDSGWHEANLNIASEITLEFTDEDWKWLLYNIADLPTYLQERCAEAVGYQEKKESVPVLSVLLKSQSLLVSSIAAIELANMEVALPLAFKNRLEKLLSCLVEENNARAEDVQKLLNMLL